MFKLNAKFDADLLLYLLSHFESEGHTVHMLTQQCLLPPLTSTVKLALFTHAHSSPLSLAARLHWCRTNRFHYINNGWTFSGQTLYMWWATAIHQVCNIVLLAQSFWMWQPHSTHAHSVVSTAPHWLVLGSCQCSCLHIPAHSPAYMDVTQTILIILTMSGLF